LLHYEVMNLNRKGAKDAKGLGHNGERLLINDKITKTFNFHPHANFPQPLSSAL